MLACFPQLGNNGTDALQDKVASTTEAAPDSVALRFSLICFLTLIEQPPVEMLASIFWQACRLSGTDFRLVCLLARRDPMYNSEKALSKTEGVWTFTIVALIARNAKPLATMGSRCFNDSQDIRYENTRKAGWSHTPGVDLFCVLGHRFRAEQFYALLCPFGLVLDMGFLAISQALRVADREQPKAMEPLLQQLARTDIEDFNHSLRILDNLDTEESTCAAFDDLESQKVNIRLQLTLYSWDML
jgi:hypothetical protein